ncbi:hypothetical protein [Streptomyces sp. NRRL WC-3742]|nr:hypothetical protein [Streptomyces sp. NRRL WC-3742]
MLRTRLAQAAAVATVALTGIVLAPSAATAADPVGAPTPAVTQDSLTWGS